MPETMTPSTPAAQAAADRLAGMRQPMRTVDSSLLEPAAAAPVVGDKAAKKKPKKPKATGKKRLVKPLGGLLLLFLVAHVVMGKVVKPHYSATHPAPAGAIVALTTAAGSPAITTNLSDGHLTQINISLQMSAVASSKIEAKKEDELMGDTIALLGSKTYSDLLPASGRTLLRSQLLSIYQKVLGTSDGAQEVTGVYFTTFVLQ